MIGMVRLRDKPNQRGRYPPPPFMASWRNGRRAGLRDQCPKRREGSNPSEATDKEESTIYLVGSSLYLKHKRPPESLWGITPCFKYRKLTIENKSPTGAHRSPQKHVGGRQHGQHPTRSSYDRYAKRVHAGKPITGNNKIIDEGPCAAL